MLCPMKLLHSMLRRCFLSFPARMTKRVCCGYWHMGIRWVTSWADSTQLQFCWVSTSFYTFISIYTHKHNLCTHANTHTHDDALFDQMYTNQWWVLMSKPSPSCQKQKVSWEGEKKKSLVTDVNKHKPLHQIKDIKMVPSSLFFQLYGCVFFCMWIWETWPAFLL